VSRRDSYVHLVIDQLHKPVLWCQKGPDVFDCSGLATWALWRVGGPDMRHLENAQALYNHTRQFAPKTTDAPVPGDLVFYGSGPDSIIHVATWLAGGNVVSADGASSHIKDLATARAAGAMVRLHSKVEYRTDTPFIVVHRFTQLDDLDLVSR
jgi:cell wall-associated NlpC family hydrolase